MNINLQTSLHNNFRMLATHKFCTCHLQMSLQEAERRIKEMQEPYKLEILEGIAARNPDTPITIYHLGREGEGEHWWDLCAGPHVQTTKDLNPAAVDLESLAGLTSFTPQPPHSPHGIMLHCTSVVKLLLGWCSSASVGQPTVAVYALPHEFEHL